MPMSPYPVLCSTPGCGRPAEFKIASRWSDGVTHELKPYFLSCAGCLPTLYPAAVVKRSACHLSAGEQSEPPGIFEMARGERTAP